MFALYSSLDTADKVIRPAADNLPSPREHAGSEAVRRLASAVAPGGLLLLEDYDFTGASAYPPHADLDRARIAALELMSRSGFDPHFGRRRLSELRAAGLCEVQAEGRVHVYADGTPDTAFTRLSLEARRGKLVESGVVDDRVMEHALAAYDDPEHTFTSPMMIAAWGHDLASPTPANPRGSHRRGASLSRSS